MAKRRRPLSSEEEQLWAGVARSVRPLDADSRALNRKGLTNLLRDDASKPAKADAKQALNGASKHQKPPPPPVRHPPYQPKTSAPGDKPLIDLDRRTKNRIASGRITIDGKLDLHGFNRHDAHEALRGFIHRKALQGARLVIVVTGKGTRSPQDGRLEGPGVLKRFVPEWLAQADMRPYILAVEQAAPQHGGAGALYVRLRHTAKRSP